MIKFQIFLAVFALFVAKIATSVSFDDEIKTASGKIVGGRLINITEAPYQVSLQAGNFHMCGGSIIGPKLVLTAAHCMVNCTLHEYWYCFSRILSVRAGSKYNDRGGIKIGVVKIIDHPFYNPISKDLDISLLFLEHSFPFSDEIQSIALPHQGEYVKSGTMSFVSGWGTTEYGKETGEKLLRAARVPIVRQKQCNRTYHGKITSQMICAGFKHGGVDACQG